jgi:protein prenyltransferase alpha subunit repeat containing protein 1
MFLCDRTSIEILPGNLEDWQSIEMLPGSRKPSLEFPFVLIDGNLGIPKKVMAQLYLAAVSMPWHNTRTAIAATSVILILNPAHQTALNSRKRLIQTGYLDSPVKELRFMELLLRGLIDCAKQSIIWDHRRWCLKLIRGTLGSSLHQHPPLEHWASAEEARLLPKLDLEDILREIAIVYHTCETYPRNYHAWNHWHWLFDIALSSIYCRQDEHKQQEFSRLLVDAYVELRKWTDCHPSDYTAMHQLSQCQRILDHLHTTEVFTQDLPSSSLVEHCLSLLTAFPTHESLWVHLRVVLGNSEEEVRLKILQEVRMNFSWNIYAAKIIGD